MPDLVLALLMSIFPDETLLYRMLSQDWLRTWKGWQEWDKSKRNEGSMDLSEDSFAEELVRRIVAISMDQAVTNYPSDDERRRELLMSSHLEVKHGDGAGNNCLTDSLLQGLLHHGVIIKPDINCTELEWRRRICDEVRLHLCCHEDVRLRPKQRDERSAIRCVSLEEHNRAYLEHHRHAVGIVQFLVSKYAEKNIDLSCGFSVTVYSRFDGDVINPENDMLIINRNENANKPCLSLLLYNNTGVGATGYHYDPIVPAQRRVRQREAVSDDVGNHVSPLSARRPTSTKKSLCSLKPKPKAASQQKKATFLCVEDPFSKRCTSTTCGGGCEEKHKDQNKGGLVGNEHEELENAEPDLGEEEEYNGFYVLNCKVVGSSPDKLR